VVASSTAADSVYWNEMAQRLLSFALAFVVIGGPLAGHVCEAVCAEHVGHSIDLTASTSHYRHDSQSSHHRHSDAPPTPETQNAALQPLPHPCGHVEAVVTESRKLTRPPVVKAVVTIAGLPTLVGPVLPMSQMDSRHGPPTPIRAASPLRV
jgi:hypothetical protein